MFKKWGAGLLSGTVMLSLLAGCGGGGDKAESPSASASANKGPVTLRLYTFDGREQTYNWKATLAAYEQKNPNVKVELVGLSDKGDTNDALKKLDLAAASGESMDVIMFSDPASYAQRVGLGMVAPIDDYINKEGYKVNEEYKVDTALNGKHYALPGKFNPWYVLLNKNHLDEAGLTVPKDWTWDQFMEYAKKLTKPDAQPKRYGTYFHGPTNTGGWTDFIKLYMANQPANADLLKADGTSNLDSPNFKKSLELRYKMEKVDKSAVPYADMISQKLAYRTQFFNQAASMLVIGSWMNTELGGTDAVPLNFNVAVAPMPKNNASDPSGYTTVTTDYVTVAATSKNKEEAYKFVRWYTTEGQIVQAKNVPAWSKVKNEDLGKIVDTILSGTKNPEKVDKESLKATLIASKAPALSPPVTYQSEIYTAVANEFEKLILDKEDVDAAVKNAQDQVNKIIANNKK